MLLWPAAASAQPWYALREPAGQAMPPLAPAAAPVARR